MRQFLKKEQTGYLAEVQDFFQGNWDENATHNLYMLTKSSVVACAVMLGYLIYDLTCLNTLGANLICVSGLLIQLCFSVLIRRYGRRLRWRPRAIRAFCLIWQISLLGPMVYMATVGTPDMPSVFFAPFLLTLTMMFVLPPWQSVVLNTAAAGVFLLLSGWSKPPKVFQRDMISAAVTWALSLILCADVLLIRMKDYRQRRELTHLSRTDCLTGLMNKSTAEASARQYLSASDARKCAALFVIDLDQFKQINDVLGHQAGDEALETVGNTLLKLFRAQDIVGRVGGDEFIALMKNTGDRKLISRRASAICNTVRRTRLAHPELSLTCSIGVAVCPENGSTYDQLFQSADEQLYTVKRNGRDGYRLTR